MTISFVKARQVCPDFMVRTLKIKYDTDAGKTGGLGRLWCGVVVCGVVWCGVVLGTGLQYFTFY